MSDQPKIQFFEFKARRFCVWFDTTATSGDYDGLVATQVVSVSLSLARFHHKE